MMWSAFLSVIVARDHASSAIWCVFLGCVFVVERARIEREREEGSAMIPIESKTDVDCVIERF